MGFDRLAPHYRWLEFVLAGTKLQRCRTAFLNERVDARRVLILGEGNGRFLAECRRRLEKAHITCVDGSSRMLQLARQRLLSSGLGADQTTFIHADALHWSPAERTFDLIVTHFFLDCFRPDQLQPLLAKLAGAATPNAAWWVADFQIPTSGLVRYRAAVIHRLMYWFFRVFTGLPAARLTPPDTFLQAHGFVLCERVVSEWGLLHSDLWRRPFC